ncbi:MAG TPA: zf-HC2 domain-containing protein [Longimicrobium sp.]|jgi:anti-sigma-K factor RskA
MITHEQALERLDDFAGGELPDRERRAVQLHLQTCAECRAEVDALRSLLDEARFLPREIAPGRDLWAGIESRLEPRGGAKVIPLRPRSAWAPPRWMTLAAAAVVLMIGTSVTTMFFMQRGGDPAPDRLPGIVADQPAAPTTTALVALQPAEAEYQKAIDDLAAVLETRRSRLAPETVATLERNLRIIDQAIAESRAALERDPSSRELAQMLSAVYDTKVRMLQQAVEL